MTTNSTDPPGLAQAEAARRQREEPPNALPQSRPRGLAAIGWEVIREPMFVLLVGCTLVYLLLGELQDAVVLGIAVVAVMTITLVQERRTEHALAALRDLSSPRALVIRDGQRQRIPGVEVVRGDLMVLAEGDRVPADALLLQAGSLSVDESMLTGESVPVRKAAADPAELACEAGAGSPRPPGGDDSPWVFSGSLVVQGQAIARVEAVGAATALGRIGHALQGLHSGATPMQRQTRVLVRRVAAGAVALSLLIFVVYWLTRGDWVGGLLAGLASAMALLPEEFPVVLTIFLAFGAWRISRHGVLTRQMPAIEALGSATVLCVDKTGTLTENRMAVSRLVVPSGDTWDLAQDAARALPEAFHALAEFAVLASHRDPFDPMERAILRLADDKLAGTEHLHADWVPVHEYPLAPQLLAMSIAWQATRRRAGAPTAVSGDGPGPVTIATKGAPEAVVDLCHLPAERVAAVLAQATKLADAGLRVLGVARATAVPRTLPDGQHDLDFEFLGLLALRDPVRAAVPAAVAACRDAGIRVIMITGDYPNTAQAIAATVGLVQRDRCLTGAQIATMDEAALREALRHHDEVARAVPEHKLRIVQALKADGHVVAMTGDGVNDAPALRAADIGVAMGGRGSDVAREAAALVLTDDDFTSIVRAVALGRRIFDNLRNATGYIVSVHVPTAFLSLLPVLLGTPLLLLPAHIAFLELVIDPACSIAFEAEPGDEDLMRRPPRDATTTLYDTRTLAASAFDGLIVLAAATASWAWGWHAGLDEAVQRAMVFVTLVAGNLALIVTKRARHRSVWQTLRTRNDAFWVVAAGTVAALVAVLGIEALRAPFRFAALSAGQAAIAAGLGAVAMAALALVKLQQRKAGR